MSLENLLGEHFCRTCGDLVIDQDRVAKLKSTWNTTGLALWHYPEETKNPWLLLYRSKEVPKDFSPHLALTKEDL